MADCPGYLRDYTDHYAHDPRGAAIAWLRDAKYGLFLHYGLYSLLGRHEWLQHREQIRPHAYAQLMDWFTADRFDARFITDLAVDAGMKYVCITTRHHDSFCLFRTKQTTFHSLNAPARRDLVHELAEACRDRQLGLCLYYSHGRDWKHPHAPNNDAYGGAARPDYDSPEPTYATGPAHDLSRYIAFMEHQITELLTQYGPIASIWLDGIGVLKKGDPEPFHCQRLYDMIHSLQPQVLVSYKDGITGTEDYYAPEHGWDMERMNPSDKPAEVCACLSGGWGYMAGTEHKSPDEVWGLLTDLRGRQCNLLLNTGPLPDGAIDSTDVATLRAVGERLRQEGFPA